MEIYTTNNFWKSVPKEKKKRVETLLLRIRKEAVSSGDGIFGTSRRNQTRKFGGCDHFFKFRVNESERIIFSYSDSIKNLRDDDKDGIYLHRYVSHDEQLRVAKEIGVNDKDGFIDVAEYLGFKVTDIEPINKADALYKDEYESYVDIESAVTYLIGAEEEEGKEMLLKDARIDRQQYEYIMNLAPMLVIGGAGSGKTLVSIHKARTYRGYENRVAYFTLSEHLRNNSETIYRKMKPNVTDIEFHSLREYCLAYLHANEKTYVGFDRFQQEFYSNFGAKNFDAFDVWAEIRGLLKGYMGAEWFRPHSFNFNSYQGNTIAYLKKQGVIASINGNDRILQCTLKNEQELSLALQKISTDVDIQDVNLISQDLRDIYQDNIRFRYANKEDKLIEEDIYQNLDPLATIYDFKERRQIYKIATQYQDWLDQNKFMDDNDLAAHIILKLRSQEKEQKGATFNFLVVDEVQDLTELQIFMLAHLVKSFNDITFAGDIHQIINPTYFRNERLKKLYHLQNSELEICTLSKNYRSQKSIVELANRLSEIRRKKIAKEKEETEQLEIAMLDGNMPFYLRSTQENLKKCIQSLSQRANACIIIAEEKDRNQLENLVGEPLANLFTIQEIKGLEYEYVFCYNLVSNYAEGWKDIFEDNAHRNSKYRYYFNVFYVAITRATENLCVFEEREVFRDKEDLMSDFIYIDNFDEDALGINGHVASPEEWHSLGMKMEMSERYDLARRYFGKANSIRDVNRCKAKLEFEEGNHQFAIDELIRLKEYITAYDLSSRINDKHKMLISKILSGKQDAEEIDREYGGKYVSTAMAPYISQTDIGPILYENYVAEKIELTRIRITEATRAMEGMVGQNG